MQTTFQEEVTVTRAHGRVSGGSEDKTIRSLNFLFII